MPNFLPLFVPIAPLIAALITALPNRYLNHKNYKISWWIIFAGFVTSLAVLWQAIQSPEPIRLILFSLHENVLLGEILPEVAFSFDRLSAVMMVVISGFGVILYRYSVRYLQQDFNLDRYLTLLAFKGSTLLFMVSSDNLVMIFICWQVSSWLLSLLSHNYAHVPTAQGAFRTFIMLRAGDMAFVSGIVIAYHLYGTVQLSQLFERAAIDQTVFSFFGTGLEITGATAITLLIFIGAMSKSAQFPLHMWLPDALYAPTPIHALLHSGGVNAGGFLLTRLAPLYVLSPLTLNFVLLIGLVTAILGTSMMLVQNDIKKSLGYSTIGQMGYMIMECGLGAFSMAVFHLVAHGLFKADIFLNCGKVIHEARLHPIQPKQYSSNTILNIIGWITVFILSFLLPLFIIIEVHKMLGISFSDSQGLLILLLFSWVTVSQATLTLFRLKKTLITKIGMLFGITLIATAYFFAAERFTHFLIPDPLVVEAYFQAAKLPYNLFLVLTILLALSIIAGWFFSVYYQQKKEHTIFLEKLKHKIYLFFMNRLYLDGLALRVFNTLKKIGRKIDQSPVAFIIVIVFSLAIAFEQAKGLPTVSLKTVSLLLLFVLLIPLFPFHGIYIFALTRAPRIVTTALSMLFPILGICAMTWFLPEIPKEILQIISVLAVVGAFWGSIKALLQLSVSRILSYGGLALYSIVWWHFAQTERVTPQVFLYVWILALTFGGLFFAWDCIRARYGDLNLNQISGLFQPMPCFALCMGLLVMAAVGLPPFSLFFGYLGILLSPSTAISFSLIVIVGTWFVSCWYLFKLMQQILFGPYRKDLRYEDLRTFEIAVFLLVIVLLFIPGSISQDWLNATLVEVAWNTEVTP